MLYGTRHINQLPIFICEQCFQPANFDHYRKDQYCLCISFNQFTDEIKTETLITETQKVTIISFNREVIFIQGTCYF